ncbi:MAG: YcnI family protein [Burkholderiaceae bacterium]
MHALRSAMGIALALVIFPSYSHVVLGQPAALAGTSYRAALQVAHGCGASPTTTIRVQIPEQLRDAKPMPKPGWTLAVTSAPLRQPYTSHGSTVTEGVTEIVWTANSPETALPDAQYDEFVFRGGLAPVAGPVWFKVVQSCAQGSNQWVEVPSSGNSTQGLKSPAALLDVIESSTVGHQH